MKHKLMKTFYKGYLCSVWQNDTMVYENFSDRAKLFYHENQGNNNRARTHI